LKQFAKQDIKSKTVVKTVTREMFSRFSSTYSDILDMQLQILYDDAMLAEVIPEVLKVVAAITQGQKPHCENVLVALLLKLSMVLSGGKDVSPPKNSDVFQRPCHQTPIPAPTSQEFITGPVATLPPHLNLWRKYCK